MLPQTLKVTGRSALPLLRWADVMRAPSSQQVKTLEHMPGPSSAGFLWDLFFRRGLTRLHQMQVRGLISAAYKLIRSSWILFDSYGYYVYFILF